MAEITTKDLNYMSRELREVDMPYFSQEELADILERSEDVEEAIYSAAILKAENTSMQVSGVTTADSSAYFLRIARRHKPNNTGQLKGD